MAWLRMLSIVCVVVVIGVTTTSHANRPASSASLAPRAMVSLDGQVGGTSAGVVVVGDLAFVPIGPRIHTYQVQPDGSAPQFIGASMILPGLVTSMAVADGHLYVGLAGLGLWILDLREPSQPVVIGSLRTYSAMTHLALHRGSIYVADDDTGLRLIDVSDPTQPTSVATLTIPDRGLDDNVTHAVGIAVANEHALVFFADDYSGGELVAVYDLGDRRQPRFVNIIDLGFQCGSPSTALSDHVLFAVCGYGLYALDVADPPAMRVIGQARFPDFLASYLDVRGNIAVVGAAGYRPADGLGVAVVDVADAETMQVIGFVETRAGTDALAIAGDAVLVLDQEYGRNSGLRHIDIRAPTQPQAGGRVEWLGSVRHVAATTGHAFAAPSTPHLWTLTEETLAVVRNTGLAVNDLVVRGRRLHAAAHDQGLVIFDIGATAALVPVASLAPDVPGVQYARIALAGQRAYVLAGRGERRDAPAISELHVIDLSTDERPVLLGRVDVPKSVRDIAVWRDDVIVAGGNVLQVIDVADGTQPSARWSMSSAESITGLTVDEDGGVFVSSGRQLRAYRLGTDGHMSEVGVVNLPAAIAALDVAGGRAVLVVSDGAVNSHETVNAVHVVDTRDAAHMVDVGGVGVPGAAGDTIGQLRLQGDRAYLAGGLAGLIALKVTGFRPPPVFLPLAAMRR